MKEDNGDNPLGIVIEQSEISPETLFDQDGSSINGLDITNQ